MPQKPTVLCPIDFSDQSRVALRYAALVADHFKARLLLVTVNDLLLVQAAAMAYDAASLELQSHQDLRGFYRDANLASAPGADDVTYDVRTGKPAPEILKAAADGHADLIVIGTHGLSGARKAFFGATTERVLRETTVPVLVTRRDAPMVASLPEVAPSVGRILVPVDLTPATAHQVTVANGLAVALGVPLILTHVIEPLALPLRWRTHVGRADHERRTRAEEVLLRLTHDVTAPVETLLAYGDPAEACTGSRGRPPRPGSPRINPSRASYGVGDVQGAVPRTHAGPCYSAGAGSQRLRDSGRRGRVQCGGHVRRRCTGVVSPRRERTCADGPHNSRVTCTHRTRIIPSASGNITQRWGAGQSCFERAVPGAPRSHVCHTQRSI
jgi:nucleotide-binding universal stress UspA family protein